VSVVCHLALWCDSRGHQAVANILSSVGKSGDGSGNISWGLNPEDVAMFPEIEVNQAVSLPSLSLKRDSLLTPVSGISAQGTK
jgi:hypothetical protein